MRRCSSTFVDDKELNLTSAEGEGGTLKLSSFAWEVLIHPFV